MGTIVKMNAGNEEHFIASSAYCYCSTAAGTAAKTAKVIGDRANSATTAAFTLIKGTTVHVKFENSNTASNPTLAVGGSTALAIMRSDATPVGTVASTSWPAGAVVSLTYDGAYWIMNNKPVDSVVESYLTDTFTSTADVSSAFSNS